jgi:pheromone a factor receptor
MVDLAIGLGLPIMEMILHYIPQGHRFNIYGEIGCFPTTYLTTVGFVIVYVPPVAIGSVSAVYSVLAIRAFNKSRSQFKELMSSNKGLNSNRYIRLMCLAGIECLFTVPLGCYVIARNIQWSAIQPWLGWEDTHVGFSRVDQTPAMIWRLNPELQANLEISRWSPIICAFIFFFFFGFAEEARKNYRSTVQSIAKRIGVSSGSSFGSGMFSSSGYVIPYSLPGTYANISPGFSTKSKGMTSTNGRTATLPVFVQRHTVRKHDSLDSFTDMSVSFVDAGGALSEKDEKPFSPDLSIDTLSLKDVGGTLADYNDDPYSPTPSSGASSASSIASPVEPSSPSTTHIAIPEPVHTIHTVPRHVPDTPAAVYRNSLDIV